MTRLAVVGGRGWLGRAIVRAAHRRGVEALGLSRRPAPGVVAVDLDNHRALGRALARCDAVVNAAGCLHAAHDAVLTAANAEVPARLAALAGAAGWRFVQLGSAAEYGPGVAGPGLVSERMAAIPASPYGRSKLAGTRAVMRAREAGAPALVARVFNVVGAELPPHNPVHGLAEQVRRLAAARRPVVEVGDPSTVRDLSDRDWVADAVVSLALRPALPDAAVVNVCSGVPTSFGHLARALGRHLGLAVEVHDLGWPRGGRIVGDPRLLRSLVHLPPPSTSRRLAARVLGPAIPHRQEAGDLR